VYNKCKTSARYYKDMAFAIEQIKEKAHKGAFMTRLESQELCRHILTKIEADIPLYYVKDVLNLAKEKHPGHKITRDIITSTRVGRTANVTVALLLQEIVERNKQLEGTTDPEAPNTLRT
jgi:hypothetical protein